MQRTNHYLSPMGEMLMAADEAGLTGLWFVGQKHFAEGLCEMPAANGLGEKRFAARLEERRNDLSEHLFVEGQKKQQDDIEERQKDAETPVFEQTKKWLDTYFRGEEPDFMPPLHLIGTPFQKAVWRALLSIPYGSTATYGEIAEKIASNGQSKRVSARAVGGAVGRNHISIIIPCHRVIGSDGSLTGYAGGIDRKVRLLELERATRLTQR